MQLSFYFQTGIIEERLIESNLFCLLTLFMNWERPVCVARVWGIACDCPRVESVRGAQSSSGSQTRTSRRHRPLPPSLVADACLFENSESCRQPAAWLRPQSGRGCLKVPNCSLDRALCPKPMRWGLWGGDKSRPMKEEDRDFYTRGVTLWNDN